MKLSIWDVLTILTLCAIVVVGVVYLSILSDPDSSLNPFPRPTLPPTLQIPTATATVFRLPSTWTPTATLEVTQRPTLTPVPSPTQIIFTITIPTRRP